MAIITDEQMRQWANLVGQAYIAAKDAVGDATTPGTSLFEINRLYRYVYDQMPTEGIVSGCDISIATDTAYASVAAGSVRYADLPIVFPQTDVSIAKTFQYPFAATAQYGIVLAFDRSDMAQTTQAVRTSLVLALVADTSVSVRLTDATAMTQFTPPFTIHVESETIDIWAVDSNGDGLVYPSYNSGTVDLDHAIDSVAYVSKPLMPHVLFGLPVDIAYQSGGDPTTFDYYPPVSVQDYVLIGRGLVDNPSTTTTARTPVLIAVEDQRDIIDDPAAAIFTDDEKQAIGASIDMFGTLLGYQSGFTTARDVVDQMVNWSNNQTGQTFPAYWNDRPFMPTENYVRGESFWGLARMEFDDAFKEAYYDVYSSELMKTLAIFRGDIAGGQVTYSHPPTGITASPEIMPNITAGNISYGQWTYRITTVTAQGESSPSAAVTVNIPAASGSMNRIVMSWTAVTGATSYEVYRLGAEGTTFVERRLTTDGEVTTTTYTDTGHVVGTGIRRGVLITENALTVPSQLVVYVPPVDGDFNSFRDGVGLSPATIDGDTSIQNEMIFTIYGLKSDGTIGGPHTVTVPKGTTRSTRFLVGLATDLYVGLHDVTVAAGTSITLLGGSICWSPYDMAVIQNL